MDKLDLVLPTGILVILLVLVGAILPIALTSNAMPASTPTPTPAPISIPMLVRVSRYYPALGGTNCANFVDGECVSCLANGQRWQYWIGRAAACPVEWPFGTTVVIAEREWICKDRGGSVRYVNGIPWVDLLQRSSQFRYGEVVPAIVRFPER